MSIMENKSASGVMDIGNQPAYSEASEAEAISASLSNVVNGEDLLAFMDSLDSFSSAPSVSLTYNRVIKLLHLRGLVPPHMQHWGVLRSAQKNTIRQVITSIPIDSDEQWAITITNLKGVVLQKDAEKFYANIRRASRASNTKRSKKLMNGGEDSDDVLRGFADAVVDRASAVLVAVTPNPNSPLNLAMCGSAGLGPKRAREESEGGGSNNGSTDNDNDDDSPPGGKGGEEPLGTASFEAQAAYTVYMQAKTDWEKKEYRLKNLKETMSSPALLSVFTEQEQSLLKSELMELLLQK